MAILRTRMERIWVSLLFISSLRLLCAAAERRDNCDCMDKQLMEMKVMMSLLDSKISSIDSKLSNVNVLEYAFKTNTIDENIKTLNAKVDQMARQVGSIEESLKVSPSSPCPQSEQIQEKWKQVSDNITLVPAGVNVAQKMDDYGKKILQSQRDFQIASEEHQKSLSGVLEVIRSGFTKVIAKVESLLMVEGQIARATSLIHQLIINNDLISEEISSLITDVTFMKGGVSNIINTSTSLIEVAAEVKASMSFPAIQLDQAIEMGRGVLLEMTQLTELEKKIAQVSTSSARLLDLSLTENVDLTNELPNVTLNLRNLIFDIENMTSPLFMSLPYNFQKLQTLVIDAFNFIADKAQCRIEHSVITEMQSLREVLSKQNRCKKSSVSAYSQCTNSIQDLVEQNLPDLKAKILDLRSDMTRFGTACQKHRSRAKAVPQSPQRTYRSSTTITTTNVQK